MSGVQCAFHRVHVLLSNEVGQVPENLWANQTQKKVLSSSVQHRRPSDLRRIVTRPTLLHPDGMSIDHRDAFRRWHEKLTRVECVFDFRRELLEYCKSDVLLLKQGCMTFKREFEAKAGFDPFDQMTIASACNRYLRTHCLQASTIACEPLLGWGGRHVNQLPAAFEWLAWEAHFISTPIRHAHNGVRCDRCPANVTSSTDLMRRLRPSTNSTGFSGTVVRPVFRNVMNRIPDSSVVPWTTSSPYIKKNTTYFAKTSISSDRSGNVSGRVHILQELRRSCHLNVPAIAPDPSPAQSTRHLLWWTYQRLPTLCVHRDAKHYQLSTRSHTKDYKLLYNKRILDPRTFYTFPYGYCTQDHQNTLFGGRTNAYQLYRCVEGDERILYYDSRACTLTSTSTVATSSPDHLPTAS